MEEEKDLQTQKQTQNANESSDNEADSANVQSENTNIEEDYKAKYDELKDQYVRAFADFDNAKKRLEREKYQSLEYANERFGADLLPVLDTLQKALESVSVMIENVQEEQSLQNANAIKQGLELTLDGFYKALSKHGISKIATDGEFDPNLHECLMQVRDESKNDGDIAQVLQGGFTYKQRVLRPAMVSIVKNN